MHEEDIAEYLTRLKNIYASIDSKVLAKDIAKIEKLVKKLKDNKEEMAPTTRTKKPSFRENYQLLKDKKYQDMTGTRIEYESFSNNDDVINFIDRNSKTKVISETTALDLKLLYSFLTDSPKEKKGTKNEVYEAIKHIIKARRRGEAFLKP